MPELLAFPLTLFGMILLVGHIIEGINKGFDNLSKEDWLYGIGLGSLLIFVAWFF
jgi:hypothetical protein